MTRGLFSDVLMEPDAFGLINVTEPAFVVGENGENTTWDIVDNPEEYLFWDTLHPTAAGHQLLANQIVPEPGSAVLTLVGGLLLAVVIRRRSP